MPTKPKAGRPGIDPAVYFKMLIIGFFENLPSERAIASRCADSLSLRSFLGYPLDQATPDHSSLSVIRYRLTCGMFQAVFELILKGLLEHELLKGRNLGIDSSIIEANACLRALQNRNTRDDYWEYVKNLAAEAGIDPDDTKAVRQFGKKRPGRKTSNLEWFNPHDPDAKVGMTRHGACNMIYKSEHTTDLDTGAIVAAETRPGDQGDTEDLAQRILEVGETLARVCDDPFQKKVLASLTADEGYFAVEEVCTLQQERVRVIIGDPHAKRRVKGKQCRVTKETLSKARRAIKSQSGKDLLKKRGEHIERCFCHVLDHGKLRRATLRGRENLTKRQLVGALAQNLSLLMRHLTGCGTVKQWLAGALFLIFRHSHPEKCPQIAI
ncbi:transposase [Roseibacillus persicicus]|uniref:transposase n=1 Tax=Roseibacillus persicicus TaxID=454148 RepID=UPI0028100E47|nr:transposase [Roseibacillus persicicus]MDQ8192348.1 transposase [Roseibacillus persicicus]